MVKLSIKITFNILELPGFEFTIVTGQFAFIAIKDHGPVSDNPYSINVPFIRK